MLFRSKADYSYKEIEFSAYYPTHFKADMSKEIDDCISELKDSSLSHIVDNYTERTETERSPHLPLTMATLKSSIFYLYGFSPEQVTNLAIKLYEVNIITSPSTSGWNIDDDVVDNIITTLFKIFKEDEILQYKRTYSKKQSHRMEQECIRPIFFNDEYFPKYISNTDAFLSIKLDSETERDELLKLYEFIFYITLSTQMKNSIYDTSSVEIIVGTNVLKEKANVLLEGESNWEKLTGKIINKIDGNSGVFLKTTILPKLQNDMVLEPLDVYEYKYNSKRPPRFGVGRFLTQILEKNKIAINEQQDNIINDILNSQSVKKVENMLHPQENAVFLISWLIEYCPLLLD